MQMTKAGSQYVTPVRGRGRSGTVPMRADPLKIADLPGAYYQLLANELPVIAEELDAAGTSELRVLEERPRRRHFPSAVLAAAVAYAQPHPANPLHGDPSTLALA